MIGFSPSITASYIGQQHFLVVSPTGQALFGTAQVSELFPPHHTQTYLKIIKVLIIMVRVKARQYREDVIP